MSNADEKPPAGEQHLDPKAQAQHENDVIIAPRGTKRGRFIMTFLIVVLVLTTFTVSDQVMNVFGVGSGGGSYVSWKGADGSTRQMSESEFVMEKRKLAPRTPNDDPERKTWLLAASKVTVSRAPAGRLCRSRVAAISAEAC